MDWLAEHYLWIKALHIISVIAWMAGMLYLPRLFVYHADAAPGSDKSETFKVMERRLLRAIMDPAMTAAIVFGGLLIAIRSPGIWQEGWWHVKIVLILAMIALHTLFGRWQKAFAEDRNSHSARFFRMMNEAPTLIMIAIVLLAVAKPF